MNEDSVSSGESPVAEHQPAWARRGPGSRRLCTGAGQLRLPPAAAFAGVADPETVPLQTPLPRTRGVIPCPSFSRLFAPNMRSVCTRLQTLLGKLRGVEERLFKAQEQPRKFAVELLHSKACLLAYQQPLLVPLPTALALAPGKPRICSDIEMEANKGPWL